MDKKKIKLSFETYIIEEDKTWFTAFDHNGLYCNYNGSEEAVLEAVIPDERRYAFRLYAEIKKYKSRIFLIPFSADEVAVYDISKKIFTKLPLKKVDEFGQKKLVNENAKFWCSKVYKRYLFLFPHNYPAMAIIDMHTLEISYVSDFVDELEQLSVNNEPYITDVCVENEMAYCSCACAKAIVQIELKSRNIKIIKVPVHVEGFNGILKIGRNIWLIPRVKGGVVCFDLERNTTTLFDDYPEGFSSSYVPFHTLYKCKKGILLIPALSEQFVLLNTKTGKMENIKYLSDLICGDRIEDIYSCDKTMAYSMEDETISFMSGKDYGFYKVNMETEEVFKNEFYITNSYPQKECYSLANLKPGYNLIFVENEAFDICDYIECVEDLLRLRNNESKLLSIDGKGLYEKLIRI